MRPGWWFPPFLCLCAAIPRAGAGEIPPERVRAAAAEVRRSGGFQEVLPGADVAPEGASGDRFPRVPLSPGRAASPEPDEGPGPMAVVLRALLWIALGVAASLLAVAGIRSRAGRTAPPASAGPAPAPAAGEAPPPPPGPLADIDRIAAEGRFGEALHALLLRAIEDLRSARSGGFPDEFTSREIAAASGLPPVPSKAFDALVRSVELTLFGRRSADRDRFAAARGDYLVVRGACPGGPA